MFATGAGLSPEHDAQRSAEIGPWERLEHLYTFCGSTEKESQIGVLGLPALTIPSVVDGDYFDAVVSYIENCSRFYVQLKNTEDDIVRIFDDMQTVYKDLKEEDMRIFNPFRGLLVAAKYPEDDCWYRATFMNVEHPYPRDFKVYFVDYGNTAVVPSSRLKILKEPFKSQPPFSILCALDGVSSAPLRDSKFLELVDTTDTCLKIKRVINNVMCVELVLIVDDVEHNINSGLVMASPLPGEKGRMAKPEAAPSGPPAVKPVVPKVSPTPAKKVPTGIFSFDGPSTSAVEDCTRRFRRLSSSEMSEAFGVTSTESDGDVFANFRRTRDMEPPPSEDQEYSEHDDARTHDPEEKQGTCTKFRSDGLRVTVRGQRRFVKQSWREE